MEIILVILLSLTLIIRGDRPLTPLHGGRAQGLLVQETPPPESFPQGTLALPYKMHVKLEVLGTTGAEDRVRGYMTRELCSIQDVDVTDDEKPLLAIHLIMLESKTNSGKSIGYVMSIAITDRSGIALIEEYCRDMTSGDKALRNFGQAMPKHGILATHILRIVNSDSLQQNCKSIVANINKGDLDDLRMLYLEHAKEVQGGQQE